MTGTGYLILFIVLVLFLFSVLLAVAEMAFARMSRIRALSLEEEGAKGASRLVTLMEHPEQTINSLLLLVLFAQLTSASLVGILLIMLVTLRTFLVKKLLESFFMISRSMSGFIEKIVSISSMSSLCCAVQMTVISYRGCFWNSQIIGAILITSGRVPITQAILIFSFFGITISYFLL